METAVMAGGGGKRAKQEETEPVMVSKPKAQGVGKSPHIQVGKPTGLTGRSEIYGCFMIVE